VPVLDSEALDFRAASESYASVRKLARRDLETRCRITDDHGKNVPTVGGMILFGRDRQHRHHFPDAWIQAGRFEGTDTLVIRARIRLGLRRLRAGDVRRCGQRGRPSPRRGVEYHLRCRVTRALAGWWGSPRSTGG
jgi:hypothetical protein